MEKPRSRLGFSLKFKNLTNLKITNMKKSILLAAILIALNIQTFSQFKISGEFRTRAEANNGYKYLPDSNSITQFYVTQRSRITMDYKKEKFQLFFCLQNVSAWGNYDLYEKSTTIMNTASTDFHQAWLKYSINDNNFIKFGRQVYDYDDGRLLSDRNWIQYGLSYDGFLYSFNKNKWIFDAQFSYNALNDKIMGDVTNKNNSYYDGSTRRMKSLNFLYLKRKITDNFYVSGLGITSLLQAPNTINTFYLTGTYGLHVNYKSKRFDVVANGFGQSGKNYLGKEIKGAYMATISADYKFLDEKLKIGVGYDMISGADGTDTNSVYKSQVHTFDLLYGARYKYFGYMNQYVLMDTHTKNGGLNDLYFSASYSRKKNCTLKATYHLFSLANDVYWKMDGTTKVYFDRSLGGELDLTYTRKINDEASILGGFSYYLVNDNVENFKGIGAGNSTTPFHFYLMFTYKPVFIK